MKTVIQRVISANVSVDGEIISSIGKGLCVLIGISRDDTEKDIDYMVRKILNVRLFEDDNNGKMWKCSVKDKQLEILCLSQITLYHSLKGNKPDFHLAMSPELSRSFYNKFLEVLKRCYREDRIKEGVFGKHIVVGIQNDGPVTINLESPKRDDSLDKEEQTVPNLE